MTIKCPKCQSVIDRRIVFENDGSNNIDGLGYYHLMCLVCGNHFLKWKDEEKAKEVFKNRPEYL